MARLASRPLISSQLDGPGNAILRRQQKWGARKATLRAGTRGGGGWGDLGAAGFGEPDFMSVVDTKQHARAAG